MIYARDIINIYIFLQVSIKLHTFEIQIIYYETRTKTPCTLFALWVEIRA